MRIVGAPNRVTTSSIARSTAARSVVSTKCEDMSASESRSSRTIGPGVATSNSATAAPADSSALAYWLPSRPVPPVTTATWPSRENGSIGADRGVIVE